MTLYKLRQSSGCWVSCFMLFLLPAALLLILQLPPAASSSDEPPSADVLMTNDLEVGTDSTPVYGYKIVNVYPHDPDAFTQGLLFDGGYLYESTGLYGRSSVRKVELATGRTVIDNPLPPHLFGEGLVKWKETLIQLSWRSHLGFIYQIADLRGLGSFNYPGEGWGITEDASCLIMSDGTPVLRFWDPSSFKEVRHIEVRDQGAPVKHLNELEYIKGVIFANVWQTSRIAMISPDTGEVLGWLDLLGLRATLHSDRKMDVLNGIAYDAGQDRIFVTGKLWPALFEIQLVAPRPKSRPGS